MGKFASPRVGRYSDEALRSETAAVYHGLTHKLSKMVAAERGVGLSRIHRMAEGLDANPIEALVRDMDRVQREGEGARLVAVLAYFEARYAAAQGPGDGLDDEVADFARAAGELLGKLFERLVDGLDEDDLQEIALQVGRVRRRCDEILGEAKRTIDRRRGEAWRPRVGEPPSEAAS